MDPDDVLQSVVFSKRNFLFKLFKIYNKLPILESLKNFAQVYNDLFVKELPGLYSYTLYEMQIAEITYMDTPGEIFVIPFKFNFCNGSRSFVNYASSETFMEALKACCRRLKAQDNQDRNLDLSKRGKPPQPD